MHRAAIIGFLGAVACASTLARSPDTPDTEVVVDQSDQPIRIALATAADNAKVGGSGAWRIYSKNSTNFVTRGAAGETMTIESRGGQLVAVKTDGSTTSRHAAPFLVRSANPDSYVMYNGKRYRGELIISPNGGGLLVVNRLGVESYLRGVVPLEIGDRKPGEEAAVEAQAVAARSYTYTHMSDTEHRGFDMYGSVQDQAYGGVDAEKPMHDAAVNSTRGMVLRYGGRVISAPYSSTCGGSTAAVSEVWWRQSDQPYLRPVSDKIPGTDSYYCDASSRFRWTSTFDAAQLKETLEKYLGSVTNASEPPVTPNPSAPRLSLGRITSFQIQGRTASDRVAAVSIQTDRGNYVVRGNDVRFVLRTPSGGLLNSTYFTAESTPDANGAIAQLVLHGGGYGHGIGMCQFGAIGRARAGQDYKTILTTYYPGTTVGRID
ncbi:MAG TPA: SpoIID/LytB domain-containing protein [Gemmatimonadaceae bacterium]|jgi:stage II sporulation protein D|nr:SpoIID/LytB domain-containing protein [Gemmatimonadaceae bacterium]